MYKHPNEPCNKALALKKFQVNHSPVTSNGCHAALIFIPERFHLFAADQPLDIFCHKSSLLHCRRCDLRMSLWKVWITALHDACISNGKNVFISFYAVKFINLDASCSANGFC